MKNLVVLAKCNLNSLDLINALVPKDEKSPLFKLKNLVFLNNNLNDQQVMKIIYGRNNLPAFSKLKSRLRDVLLRSIILQNFNDESSDSRTNENYHQFRNSIAINLLSDKREYSLSIELAEISIRKSIKYNFTENVLLLARLLVRHYGVREFNKYKFNKYLTILKLYLKIQEVEFKAENYFLDLQSTQLQSLASPSEKLKIKAKEYMMELNSINNIKTYTFLINRYKVKAIYFEYVKDYESLLKISDEIKDEFVKYNWKANTFLRNMNLRKEWALIQACRNEDAIQNGLNGLSKIPYGSLGWYLLAHYTLKALLYSGNYKQSIVLISEMIDNNKFNKISENYKELFYTTLGYIHLIVDSGIFSNIKKSKLMLPEFKLYKFLNDIPVFSKDKRGINVSILLMHIAFLLQRKEYDTIIDRIDSLNHYAYRHLRRDDTFRSNCMIKMVVQMTKADFHPLRTKRYTEDLLNQLEQVKLAGSGENIETEIIPYEVLWQIMMKSL